MAEVKTLLSTQSSLFSSMFGKIASTLSPASEPQVEEKPKLTEMVKDVSFAKDKARREAEEKEVLKNNALPSDNRTPEQKEAEEFKLKGNELYKKKQFREALEIYDEAIEREPNEILYLNNKCAVWVEMGAEFLDLAMVTLQDVVDRRCEFNSANPGGASVEKVAKVLSRMASIYEKKKQFDKAIEMYNKSLTEVDSNATRNALRELAKAREKLERRSSVLPAMAVERHGKLQELPKVTLKLSATEEEAFSELQRDIWLAERMTLAMADGEEVSDWGVSDDDSLTTSACSSEPAFRRAHAA